MPFLEHLEELRWRIFKAAGALVIGTFVGFYLIYRFDVLKLVVDPVIPFLEGDQELIFLNPVTPFFFILKTSLLVGILLALPIVLYQVWGFLSPALEKKEKRVIVPSLYGGLILFALGALLAYEVALPVSLEFLLGIQTDILQPMLSADEYFAFFYRLLIAFGVIFELPVVVLILSVLGLVTPRFLREKRRHALVIITVAASLLSPGDVVMVTIIMMIPLVFLYEISILLSAMVDRKKEEALQPAEEPPVGSVEME